MSEHETPGEQTPENPSAETASEQSALVAETPPEEPLFDAEELAEFVSDDAAAGGNICRMLAFFFLYTVIAMAISGWWAYHVVSE